MKSTWILLRAEIASLHHLFDEMTARVGLMVVMLFAIAINVGLSLWFAPHLAIWLQAGSIADTQHLWSCIGILWLMQLIFTVVSTINRWLSAKQSALLLPLPLSPAIRFRSLYLITFFLGAGLRMGLFFLFPLLLLARYDLGWFLLAITGAGIATLLGIIGTLFFLGYLFPAPRLFVGLLGIILLVISLIWVWAWQMRLSFSALLSFAPPSPVLIGGLFALLLVLLLGPGATTCGRFYVAAYQKISNQTKGHQARTPRWLDTILWRVLGNRPLLRAMIYKGIINQLRIKLNLVRALLLLISIPVFWLLITHHIVPTLMPPTFLLVAYSSGAGLYTFFDAISSPIGSEGMRLQLYLTSPFSTAEILRSKFFVYLACILSECFLLCLICALIVSIDWHTTLIALLLTMLISLGMTALIVWGSVWDEDIYLLVEGEIPLLFHEQMPFTPRRLTLLALCLLLYSIETSITWSVSFPSALLLLAGIDAFILSVTWKFSSFYLLHLFKRG